MRKLLDLIVKWNRTSTVILLGSLTYFSARVGVTRDWRWAVPAIICGLLLGHIVDRMTAESVAAHVDRALAQDTNEHLLTALRQAEYDLDRERAIGFASSTQ
jgi:hypothetical protein